MYKIRITFHDKTKPHALHEFDTLNEAQTKGGELIGQYGDVKHLYLEDPTDNQTTVFNAYGINLFTFLTPQGE